MYPKIYRFMAEALSNLRELVSYWIRIFNGVPPR